MHGKFFNWQLIIDKCDGHELATALLDFTDYNIKTTVNQYWYIYRTDVKLVWVVGEKWRGSGEVLGKRGAGGLNFGKVCDAKVTFQRVVRL